MSEIWNRYYDGVTPRGHFFSSLPTTEATNS